MASLSPAYLVTSGLAHPSIIDLWLLKSFGPEVYEWDPEVIFLEAAKEAKAQSVSAVNQSKIHALLALKRSQIPFTYWPAFEKTVMAFNGVIPVPEMMQKPDLGQLMVGVDIMVQLAPAHFSPEVIGYTAAALLADDIAYAPAPIEWCNEHLKAHHRLHEATRVATRDGRAQAEEVTDQLEVQKVAGSYFRATAQRLVDQAAILSQQQTLH